MESASHLEKLEAVVEKMISNVTELRKENSRLQAKLNSREKEIASLEAQINAMSTDQETISSRVSSLISSIEEWEKSGDEMSYDEGEAKGSDEVDSPENTDLKNEAQLFDMGE